MNILRKFLATEKDYNWVEAIDCVLRRYHGTKKYTGLSPNELVFGRERMGPGPVMYHPRQCYDASQWFEKIKELDSKWIRAKVESQADWLIFKNQARTQEKPFEKGQQVWFCKSDETLKDDNKLLPLWDGPFQVKSQLSQTTFNIEIEQGRHQEVHSDRLKAKVPCPRGSYKPLFWTSKYLSDRKMATSSFELEKILDYKKDARNQWYVLCTSKGFGPEEDKWEPASSFIHGYMDTIITFLMKHTEVDRELSLIRIVSPRKTYKVKKKLQLWHHPFETRSNQNSNRRKSQNVYGLHTPLALRRDSRGAVSMWFDEEMMGHSEGILVIMSIILIMVIM